MSRLVTALLSALPLAAQGPPDARAFVPRDHRCECLVDFVALRECGLWDHLQRSALVKVLDMLQGRIGVRISDLDRLRAFPETPTDEARPEGQRSGGVVVFEGGGNVGLPVADESRNLRLEKLGTFDVLVETFGWKAEDPDLFVSPKPGLLVYGTRHLVAPVLEGKSAPGVPPPEFLSLTSGRGNLAYMVTETTAAVLRDMPAGMAGTNPAPDEDPLRHVMLRVRKVGEGDEATFELQGTLRYARGTAAPEPAAKWLREQMQELGKHPRLGAMKRFWNKIEVKVDRQDVTARLDLGPSRKAASDLANLLTSLLAFGTHLEPVEAPAAVEVAVPVPVPPPEPVPDKPKGGGEKGGG